MNISFNGISNIFKKAINPNVIANEQSSGNSTANAQPATYNQPQVTNLNPAKMVSQLSIIEQNLLIKELFNMPKDWAQMLLMLDGSKSTDIKNLIQLLKADSQIDLSQFKALIGENVKQAQENLLKLCSVGTGMHNVDQYKEIFAAISVLSGKNSSNAETVNNLVLLYMPWCPIDEKSPKFFEEFIDEDDKLKSQQYEISAYLSTENFGIFKIYIGFNSENNLSIFLENLINCKNESHDNFLNNLKEKIFNELKNININAEININQKVLQNNDLKPEKRLYITQCKNFTPLIINTLFDLAKLIFNLDSRFESIKE